jgi:hypothetical protein
MWSRRGWEDAVVDVAGEFFGQVEVVVEEMFDVDAREIRISEQNHRRRDARTGFVFGDAAGMDVTETKSCPYLLLRQPEG